MTCGAVLSYDFDPNLQRFTRSTECSLEPHDDGPHTDGVFTWAYGTSTAHEQTREPL